MRTSKSSKQNYSELLQHIVQEFNTKLWNVSIFLHINYSCNTKKVNNRIIRDPTLHYEDESPIPLPSSSSRLYSFLSSPHKESYEGLHPHPHLEDLRFQVLLAPSSHCYHLCQGSDIRGFLVVTNFPSFTRHYFLLPILFIINCVSEYWVVGLRIKRRGSRWS